MRLSICRPELLPAHVANSFAAAAKTENGRSKSNERQGGSQKSCVNKIIETNTSAATAMEIYPALMTVSYMASLLVTTNLPQLSDGHATNAT